MARKKIDKEREAFLQERNEIIGLYCKMLDKITQQMKKNLDDMPNEHFDKKLNTLKTTGKCTVELHEFLKDCPFKRTITYVTEETSQCYI